ncbi:leucine-rich repeat domain-containing protein [Mycoplasmatota bacterium zrk1]
MKKIYILILVMVISLATAGFSYAYWTDTLSISGTAETGELEVAFTQEQELQKPTYVTSNNQVSDKQFSLNLDKLYPGAIYETSVEVENTGTIPAILDYVELLDSDQNDLSQYIEVTLELVTESSTPNHTRVVRLDQVPVDMLPQLGLLLDVDGPESTGWINMVVEVLEEAPNDITENETVNFTLQLNFVQFNGYEGPNGGVPGVVDGPTLNEQLAQLLAQNAQLHSDLEAANSWIFTLETENTTLEAQQAEYENWTDSTCFGFDDTSGIITSYDDSGICPTDVIIPKSIDNIKVTTIRQEAFLGSSITSLVIPDTVTTIGDYAFYYSLLTSVIIPYSVTTIGDYAFADSQLTNITIPNSIITIGDLAFANNKISSVVIPNSITTIGDYVFMNNKISNVVIPNTLTTIQKGLFNGNQLTSVTIPDSIISIGDGAFSHNKLTSVILPDSITSIGDQAFGYNKLTSVTIPNSITTIGAGAFVYNSLTSVIIPSSVTTISSGVFARNQLTSVEIPNSITTIRDRAFQFNALTSVTIPDSVTSIGDQAFYKNQLTSVTIPDSVTSIGEYAFAYNQLTSVTIPDSVTSIGWNAFYGNP